jgi:hypothetical protein
VLADTLNAAIEADVAALQEALIDIFQCYSQAWQDDFIRGVLVLDVDMSPLPASKRAEGSERGYMGRCRSKTGRKLVRVRTADYRETVVTCRTAESLSMLKDAIAGAEQLLGLAGEDEQTQGKRARTELRLDSGWGGEEMITWLLNRGYQVTGKFKSNSRVRKLVRGITDWQPTSSPGREFAALPELVFFVRPLAQYAVRTPSKEQESGYYHAVV